MDLSDCKPLRKVLALYPHRPLPAIACHAPLLVSYPEDTFFHITRLPTQSNTHS